MAGRREVANLLARKLNELVGELPSCSTSQWLGAACFVMVSVYACRFETRGLHRVRSERVAAIELPCYVC